ncbi:MAG: hypothetical protein ACHQ4G_08410 [Opitutales bacterium]
MRAEPDPPRKFYKLKEAEFERVNPLVQPPSSPPVPAPFKPIDPLGFAPVNRENEVHGMLRENLVRANETGLNDLSAKPRRKSKRRRDYIFLFSAGNLLLATISALLPILGIAFLVLYNVALIWVMWFVMEDY